MSDVLQARAPGETGRKPKTYAGHRTCDVDECPTVLSRYNPSDVCYQHAPTTFTRLRGVVEA